MFAVVRKRAWLTVGVALVMAGAIAAAACASLDGLEGPPVDLADSGAVSGDETTDLDARGDGPRMRFVEVSPGINHSCAIRDDKTVWCWGSAGGTYFALGNGSVTDTSTLVQVTGVTDAVEVDTGFGSACARKENGSLVCWGYNPYGFGNDDAGSQTATEIPLPSPAISFAMGTWTACAVLDDHRVFCWGQNENDELGLGLGDAGPRRSAVPMQVPGLVADEVAGLNNTFCVRAGGTVNCWGYNVYGGAGQPAPDPVPIPKAVDDVNEATAIAVGGNHACALIKNGAVSCWGANHYGQLGRPASPTIGRPGPVPGVKNAEAVTAGAQHTCVKTPEGVHCFGDRTYGAVNDPTDGGSDAALLPVPSVANATRIAAGSLHTCAIVGGEIDCWGSNEFARLGRGTRIFSSTPVAVDNIVSARHVAVGADHVCAVEADAGGVCWGNNDTGQQGYIGIPREARPASIGPTAFRALALGYHYSCGTADSPDGGDTDVYCWGDDSYGQRGDGSQVQPANVGSKWASGQGAEVTTGYGTTCVRSSGGGVTCAGYNGNGQLGIGDLSSGHDSPVVVPVTASRVFQGNFYTCATLAPMGTIQCWGLNDRAQTGTGGPPIVLSPTTVTATKTSGGIMALALGAACVAVGPTAECWGTNSFYEVGAADKTIATSSVLVSDPRFTLLQQLVAGDRHFCVLDESGVPFCWGRNNVGQLGRGTLEDSYQPQPVSGLTDATFLAARGDVTCAIRRAGGVVCWGSNATGQLGDGTLLVDGVPAPVSLP